MASPTRITTLVAGGTGAVGRSLIAELLHQKFEVIAWGRRRTDADGVNNLVGDLATTVLPRTDAAFCCLGTTHAKAGSAAAFRAVDFDLVVQFARSCRASGTDTLILVSSLGSDKSAMSHYLRVKGDAEAEVGRLGFRRLVIVRPSLLLDDRPDRPLEHALVTVSRWTAPLLSWLPSRAIEVRDLARAMIHLVPGANGLHIIENPALHQLGKLPPSA